MLSYSKHASKKDSKQDSRQASKQASLPAYNGKCNTCAAGVDRSLRISLNMVTKALLQYLMLLAPDPDFPELWARILQVLQVLFTSDSCFPGLAANLLNMSGAS